MYGHISPPFGGVGRLEIAGFKNPVTFPIAGRRYLTDGGKLNCAPKKGQHAMLIRCRRLPAIPLVKRFIPYVISVATIIMVACDVSTELWYSLNYR
jgi:hypothetical protein